MTIKTKLLLSFAVIGLLPVTILMILGQRESKAIADGTAEQYAQIAHTIADKIDRNIFERYGDVQAFGLNHAVRDRDAWYQADESNPIVEAMNGYVDAYDIYYLTILSDLEGRTIAVNTRDHDGSTIDTAYLYDRNWSDASWHRDAIAGRFYESEDGAFTGTVVDHLHVDADAAKTYGDEGYALGFTAPVKDASGETIAIWHNVTKFSLVEEIFQCQYAKLADRGLASAELTLLDSIGRIIVDYDPTTSGTTDVVRDPEIIQNFNLAEKGVESAARVVKGESGSITKSFHARKKIDQVAGFTPLTGALGFPGMQWNVLVRVSCDEALATSNRLESSLLLAMFIGIGGITVVSFFSIRSILGPISATVALLKDISRSAWTIPARTSSERWRRGSTDSRRSSARSWFRSRRTPAPCPTPPKASPPLPLSSLKALMKSRASPARWRPAPVTCRWK